MKMKKAIARVLIILMIAILGIAYVIPSLAAREGFNLELQLSLNRYINGDKKCAYKINNKPIFQIMSSTADTNYYCLNAGEGDSWRNNTIGAPATYNKEYDLNSQSDIDALGQDSNRVYSDIVNGGHLNQILWILENVYVPGNSVDDNTAQKRAILERAGLSYGTHGNIPGECYQYIPKTGYDYSSEVSQKGKRGYWYGDVNGNFTSVEIPDEMVVIAGQTALWYYTNYLEHNQGNSQTYNVREHLEDGLKLYRTLDKDSTDFYSMWANNEGHPFNHTPTNAEGMEATVEKWQEEMATILCWYLIDAANNYASTSGGAIQTGNPLTVTTPASPNKAGLNKKTVNNTEYYVVGPIKIDETRTAVYTLNNTITVNNDTTTGAYISDAEGNRNSDQTVKNYVGSNFYVAIPKSKVSGQTVNISFGGKYNSNEKKLYVNMSKTEQPIVKVEPRKKDFELIVPAEIEEEEEKFFDLALRKRIAKINGQANIFNEKGLDAKRAANSIDTTTIPNTATYKHRKDPVVVENGDVVTYSITVYNEGDMPGYAKTIVDKLPNGIVPKNSSGTYTSANINYSYIYDNTNNTITFTNVSKNVLAPYTGQTNLSSETIEIECEVTQEPSTTTNNYLTNIAYISGAHNTETNQDVEQDRDSSTNNNPSANLNTTGDTYTGYHGGSNKDVYSDTNNNVYFEGQEDDDDFEIVVVKPAKFDLALKKYIANVISPDGTVKPGKSAPTINTEELASGAKFTADYGLDINPIKVKSGDYVLYNFTVYNEGQIDGIVKKITDNIPTGLEFVYIDSQKVYKVDSKGDNRTEIEVPSYIYQAIDRYNTSWRIDKENESIDSSPSKMDTYNGESTISITCDIQAAEPDNYAEETGSPVGSFGYLKAYDSSKEGNNHDGSGLDRLSVQVLLRVSASNGTVNPIRNEAAITEATDKEGNVQDVTELRDRDSQTKPVDNVTEPWPGKDEPKNYQDDEDYDHILLERVDLALTKFITAYGEKYPFKDGEYLTADGTEKDAGSKTNPFDRATQVKTLQLLSGATDAEYELDKSSLTIPAESYILYNIRVYNEGDVDVYAGEVTDYLPNYLTFVQGEFNDQYGWKEVSTDTNGTTVKTDYLSYEKNRGKILKAFNYDGTDDGYGSKLDYQDLPILCRVKADAPNKARIINSAEISKYEDENGNEIETDIDSQPDNLPDDKKNKEGKTEGRYDQDDEDYEVVEIITKKVDLALTKFLIAVSADRNFEDGEWLTDDTTSKNAGSATNKFKRATEVDTKDLKDKEDCHDAKYTLVKDSWPVPAESYVLYNIRVYNEGEVDVYAGEVKDYLPDYLEFVPGEENDKYGWKLLSDGKTVVTDYLSYAKNQDKILDAFNKEKDQYHGEGLDYEDLPILCKVKSDAPSKTRLINSTEITKYENKDGNEIETDIDSQPDNLPDDKKNKEGKSEGRYNQDDEDYEVIEVKKPIIDLALKKFIAAVSIDSEISDGEYYTANGSIGSRTNPYKRAPEVKTKDLRDDPNCHDATYIMVKDPLTVPARSYVLYNIRVYNEGETDVYAGEVTDYLPDELEYVYNSDINTNFGWKVSSDGKTVTTDYLSYAKNQDKILKAFDKVNDDEHGKGLDYQDLQVLCRVRENVPTNTQFVNFAEITRYENRHGDPIPDDDIDSKPKNYEKRHEDDDDYEIILIKKFDLSLLKYVTEVYITEDGKTKTIQTGNTGDDSRDIIPKVEINKKKLNSTVVKFGYTIKITNEGEIEGYAKEITDYVPVGLKFYAEDNNGWKDEGNNVISTRLLENTLLKPGESAEVKVILRWINGSNNLGLKTNTAEISEDYNKEGIPDIDSIPDNRKYGEDDIDDAKVILSIKTGLANNIVMYSSAGLLILIVLGAGVYTIKKYVL